MPTNHQEIYFSATEGTERIKLLSEVPFCFYISHLDNLSAVYSLIYCAFMAPMSFIALIGEFNGSPFDCEYYDYDMADSDAFKTAQKAAIAIYWALGTAIAPYFNYNEIRKHGSSKISSRRLAGALGIGAFLIGGGQPAHTFRLVMIAFWSINLVFLTFTTQFAILSRPYDHTLAGKTINIANFVSWKKIITGTVPIAIIGIMGVDMASRNTLPITPEFKNMTSRYNCTTHQLQPSQDMLHHTQFTLSVLIVFMGALYAALGAYVLSKRKISVPLERIVSIPSTVEFLHSLIETLSIILIGFMGGETFYIARLSGPEEALEHSQLRLGLTAGAVITSYVVSPALFFAKKLYTQHNMPQANDQDAEAGQALIIQSPDYSYGAVVI